MTIHVDADSCPRRIREIIIRASNRTTIPAYFIANRKIPEVVSDYTKMIIINNGEEAVDNYIVEHSRDGDIIITRDIPLAAALLQKEVVVLNDRGSVFTKDTINERLSIRNISKEIREAGLEIQGEKSFGQKEIKSFSDAFSRILDKKLINSSQLPK